MTASPNNAVCHDRDGEEDLSKIRIDRAGGVRTVTLTRPEKRNAIDGEMMAQLLEAFSAEPDSHERVSVIRAEGHVFCAGLDLKERRETLGDPSGIEDVFLAVETYPLPVVAVVQGAAIAGGNELALHCDFVVASTQAMFGMSLAQIGLSPTWFLTKKLMEVAGPVTTREILLLGDPIPARRMYDIGIISHLAPHDKLDAAADAVIRRLAANAPLALKSIKQLMLWQMKFRDAIPHQDLNDYARMVARSEDAREGIAARLEKRPAHFHGR